MKFDEQRSKTYENAKRRVLAGEGTDEDQRQVALLESEGYSWGGNSSEESPEQTQQTPEPNDSDRQSSAPTTITRSNPAESRGSGTAPSAEKSSTRADKR